MLLVHSLVFVKDTKGRHLLVNSYFLDEFGIKKEEIINKTDLGLFPLDIAKEIMNIDQQVMNEKKTLKYDPKHTKASRNLKRAKEEMH